MSTSKQLLTSAQVASFVAQGFLRLDGVVPQEINERAVATLTEGLPDVPYGTPLSKAFAQDTFVHDLLALPVVAGAVESLVGPEPTVDHHAVHVREPHEGHAQPLHGDAIIDVRPDAFDIQLMYYPHEVTAEMGGTLSVPGSHLRRINETDVGRVQNLRGQTRLTCPAGTVVLLHHGIWHGGRRNDTARRRYMYKLRLNPTVPQVRLWDTTDLHAPAVTAELDTYFPWYEQATARLEIYNRVLLWRALTGDESFDVEYWVTRVSNRPALRSHA
ncbi:phytanoyl-CoA dioxygenase family protein [Streptomyces europaeiscabiei]|uniref:phytanoyl-CoA dioxygenase family protein n=1 Tax=Streptomyces europaeiscabiei TaxID=146819 RepID=UPI0029BD01F8|nr:phytanoyl-CoA dioxygenase family protein [Streptomyces europaeiscabiei]MDX3845603.1 phytanoyl-CoA dioxygenase family protein [Streptomyces europaeiscabiei]